MLTRFDDGCTHHTSDLVAGAKDENANAVKLSGAATGVPPTFSAVGDDTNVSTKFAVQGTAQHLFDSAILQKRAASTLTTAGAITYTIAQMLSGLILRDPNGAGRADLTPTGAVMSAGIPGIFTGLSFRFWIRNDADASETITLTAGASGVTIKGTATIAQSNMKEFLAHCTGANTWDIYSLGTVTF